MSYDVFISYQHDDKAIAESACNALEASGLHCWIAPRNQNPGENYRKAIVRGLDESKIVVFIFSAKSDKSEDCKKELALADDRLMHIIPFRIDDICPSEDLEYLLVGVYRLDALTRPIDKYFDELVDAIEQLLKASPELDEVKASAQFHSDTQHTGNYSAVAGSVPSNGQLKWSYPTGGAVRASPVVVDGVVYFGSDDASVYAVNTATGKKIWSYATGGSVDSSPAIFDGVVYVGSNDGNVYAIKANDGTKLWSFHTEDWVQSSPVVSNGIVYVGSDDHKIYAINAATGLAQWPQPFTTNDAVCSTPAIYDGVIYVGSNDGNLYAIDANSRMKLWSFPTGASVTSSPTVGGGCVFVGNIYHFYTLGLNGALKWQIDHAVGYTQSHLSPPAYAYARGTIYIAWPRWKRLLIHTMCAGTASVQARAYGILVVKVIIGLLWFPPPQSQMICFTLAQLSHLRHLLTRVGSTRLILPPERRNGISPPKDSWIRPPLSLMVSSMSEVMTETSMP